MSVIVFFFLFFFFLSRLVAWARGGGGERRTLWFFSTTMPPLIWALCDEFFTHVATRLVFCPRCFSFAFLFCPERTASVVPMMAGHAAIAVKSPKTMMDGFVSPKLIVVTHESKQRIEGGTTKDDRVTSDYMIDKRRYRS